VSLLIGVNNQYRGYDINKYRDEFRLLLEKAIEYAGGKPEHVILLSIPDGGPRRLPQAGIVIRSQMTLMPST